MFVRAKRRFKDGKEHRYWSVVENVRNLDGRVVQRQVLYLGEINDSQRSAWRRSIEVLGGDSGSAPMALFALEQVATLHGIRSCLAIRNLNGIANCCWINLNCVCRNSRHPEYRPESTAPPLPARHLVVPTYGFHQP